MGYPHPGESPYDLFMTGHAGCSVSTVLGLKAADDLLYPEDDRKAVAVIGDGASLRNCLRSDEQRSRS
ncbi:MAG: 1-deoxy-D-xylulose-5-phosphate synthase N-terminal domain-containing protein [Planctomycetaceae bacterium]